MHVMTAWCVRHRRWVLAGWIVALLALTLISQGIGSTYTNDLSLHGTQSYQAETLLSQASPGSRADHEEIVIGVDHGTVTAPATRARIEALLHRVAALGDVASVASPYVPGQGGQISPSGQVAIATVTMAPTTPRTPADAGQTFVDTVTAGAGHGLTIGIKGDIASASSQGGITTVAIGAGAALVVLFLVFGSLLAATLPLITAGIALGISVAMIGLLSRMTDVASFASELSLLIGLGVGVDYALFVVTRYRQGLKRGKPVDQAIVEAVDTSGRAVLFAGLTVCIALMGMFALGIGFLYGVAIAACIAVLLTVASALTLLPALLGFFGTRVLRRTARRERRQGRVVATDSSPRWARWARTVGRRPVAVAAAATILMVLLAAPFFAMRLGSADAGTNPVGTPTRTAYDLIARGFGPGVNGPLLLVARVDGHGQQVAFAKVLDEVSHTAGVVGVSPASLVRGTDGTATVMSASVDTSGAPQDASTSALLTTLRDRVIPAASRDGLQVLIGGQTATINDFSAAITAKLPVFIGAVLGLSFLLLVLVFRSLLIPAIAAFMNLLTAGASFGLITAVFQWGWLDAIFPNGSTGPIEPFVPVMMFAIVFGLSMDYQVFLVTRIYEEWHRTGDTRVAVTRGLAATGRTITAAAAIMVLVFAAFILGGDRVIELFGLGLAGAVFLDAVVVRSALVPALMFLGGKANWWMPRQLDRVLPHLNVEGDAQPAAHPPAPPTGPAAKPMPRPVLSKTPA